MVGSAVETIVWSSAASIMPIMRAPMITRIRRCSSLVGMWSAAGATVASTDTGLLHVLGQAFRELRQQGGERLQLVLVPILDQVVEPGPAGPDHALNRPRAGPGQADPGGAPVVRVG